jgi:hypothetical protein
MLVYVSLVEPWNLRSKPPQWRVTIAGAPKTPHTVLHHGTPPRTRLKARENIRNRNR